MYRITNSFRIFEIRNCHRLKNAHVITLHEVNAGLGTLSRPFSNPQRHPSSFKKHNECTEPTSYITEKKKRHSSRRIIELAENFEEKDRIININQFLVNFFLRFLGGRLDDLTLYFAGNKYQSNQICEPTGIQLQLRTVPQSPLNQLWQDSPIGTKKLFWKKIPTFQEAGMVYLSQRRRLGADWNNFPEGRRFTIASELLGW